MGKADAAGTAAQIQNPGVLLQKQRLADGKLCHGAGIVPGNEYIRRYPKGQAVKLPLPQHVGQRAPRPAAAGRRGSYPGKPAPTHTGHGLPEWLPDFSRKNGTAAAAPSSPPSGRPRFPAAHGGCPDTAGRIASPTIRTLLLRQHGLYRRNAHLNHGVVRLVGGKMRIHMPGAESARVKALSFLPHQRLIS